MIAPLLLLVTFAPGHLKITDVHVGKGAKAASGDVMTMLYKGTLQNGKVFDQNFDKAPFVFTLGGGEVIKGWDKGLAGMKVGGERKLVIPPDLAYGSQSMGEIPANSTLNFDVKLLRIDTASETPKLQITNLAGGSGKAAKDGNSVGVYYTGAFLNGVVFDSSYKHIQDGKPFMLPVTIGEHHVIPGFERALVGMKVGGKRKVVIPYQLGYGDRATGPIPAKSTLVFTLEMKSIS